MIPRQRTTERNELHRRVIEHAENLLRELNVQIEILAEYKDWPGADSMSLEEFVKHTTGQTQWITDAE